MSKNSTLKTFVKRIVVFAVGIPGYVLTIAPWLFVVTIIAIGVSNLNSSGQFSLQVDTLSPQTIILINPSDVYLMTIVTAGLWGFFAWLCKHLLLYVSRLFGESEMIWQQTKFGALALGWAIVLILAAVVFRSVQPGFLLSELIVISIGSASFGLEYVLSRFWLTKK